MWDRSYRWQSYVRLIAGVGVLLLLCGTLTLLGGTSTSERVQEGARDLARNLLWPSGHLMHARVPADLQTQVGTLVYSDRKDGVAQVIGRVASMHVDKTGQQIIAIRLSEAMDGAQHGGVLKGIPAALSLRDAVRLLVSPDTPDDEAAIARDKIWPGVRTNVIPNIVDALVREVAADIANPRPEDVALFQRFVNSVHQAVEPLENELVGRLAKRAWSTIGVPSLIGGTLRQAAKGEDEPLLSEKASNDLRAALEQEILSFWKEHRAEIITVVKNVIDEQRPDFEAAFQERWSGELYDRVVMPAWLQAQATVMESIEAYVNDFAKRRLLNHEGGPRLLFAYILRSYLNISVAPLLIFSPTPDDDSDQVHYQPLLP
jgi:hypothetical protein